MNMCKFRCVCFDILNLPCSCLGLFVGLDRTPPLWAGTVRDTPEELSRPRSLMDSPRAPRCTRTGQTSSLLPHWGGWSPMSPGRLRCDILWQVLTIQWHLVYVVCVIRLSASFKCLYSDVSTYCILANNHYVRNLSFSCEITPIININTSF